MHPKVGTRLEEIIRGPGACLKALGWRCPGGGHRADAPHLSQRGVLEFHLLHFHILAKSTFGCAFFFFFDVFSLKVWPGFEWQMSHRESCGWYGAVGSTP